MKRLLLFAVGMLMMSTTAFGQLNDDMAWEFAEVFPDTAEVDTAITVHQNYGVNGLAVDSAGKIWISGYYPRVPFQVSPDSTFNTRAIFVFNPDGTQAEFSPIQTVTVGSDIDTLTSPAGALTTDQNGDMLASFAGTLYRIDSETGEGLDKLVTGTMRGPDTPAFITGVSVTEAGFVLISYVFGGTPLEIWDPTLTQLVNTVEESRGGFSRNAAITRDGQDIYVPTYTGSTVLHYHSDTGVAGIYSAPDSLFKGISSEVIDINHETGLIWLSGGSVGDPPNTYPGVESNYTFATLYAFDPATGTPVDSFQYNNADAPADVKIRSLGFSPDGMTAYIGNFATGDVGAQKFVQVQREAISRPSNIPDALTLTDNYPNPFAQSTKITYGLHKTGKVTLKVYDVLGREVRTLVNRVMPVGDNHTVTFEAGDLPSGVYFYQLRTGGHQLSGKMLLVK